MQVSTLAWSDYIGRIGCGRVLAGGLKVGDELQRITTRHLEIGDPDAGWEVTGASTARVTHLWVTRGLENREVDEVAAGDIVWLAGPDEISLGDTLAAPESEAAGVALPPLEIEEPTVSMFFLVNNGPFAGQDGRAATLRQIKDRLERELRVNVALRVEDLGRPDGVKVSGRGELHLAILIEEMRREGLELCVSRPEVITHRDANGQAARADGAAHHRRARGVPGHGHPGAEPAQGRAGRPWSRPAPASCASSSRSRRAA